ncbi:NifB/NifX family molybdenum-iron cluster-binding protein [Sulfurimonas sp.]|uniref:NifB/NifX family molybdenum-iron cluster-binding protein n=1 Tax=Sulfurimonas sp. TaxID=2022749 RepID=UPI002609AB4D|nr:NifB/NifX family molybdenum-iron cluster-binding protein [Sulfurimonas sp.]
MREFTRREGRGFGRGQRGLNRGRNFGDNGSFGGGRGLGRRNFQGIFSKNENNREGLQMKVAFMTNGKERLAKHIGLAKNIVFYSLPEGEFLEMIENPIMTKIKDENIVIEKDSEGNRGLHVGTEIPRFLKANGVDVFVSYEFGKGVKDNLLALGITPVAAEKQTVDEIIQTMKNNQDKEG